MSLGEMQSSFRPFWTKLDGAAVEQWFCRKAPIASVVIPRSLVIVFLQLIMIISHLPAKARIQTESIKRNSKQITSGMGLMECSVQRVLLLKVSPMVLLTPDKTLRSIILS